MDFSLSSRMGIGVEEHLSLQGIAKSSKQGKLIIKKFDEIDQKDEHVEANEEDVTPNVKASESGDKQFTLDSF